MGDKLESFDREERGVVSEAERIAGVYERRRYDDDPRYSDLDAVYLHRVHSMERRILEALRQLGGPNATDQDINGTTTDQKETRRKIRNFQPAR